MITRLLTTTDIAKKTGICAATFRRWYLTGELKPSYLVCERICLYTEKDVRRAVRVMEKKKRL